MQPKNSNEKNKQELRYHRRTNVVLLALLFFLGVGVWRIPSTLYVYTSPDTSKPFVQKNGEIPINTAFNFGSNFWQKLNYCGKDCEQEYPKSIDNNSQYITHTCQRSLQNHFNNNKALYRYRSRLLLPVEDSMFDPKNIQKQSEDLYYVKLKYNLKDYVNGLLVRDNIVLYPLKVVRSLKPRSVNPSGLEIDCFFGDGPVVLERKLKEVQTND